MLINVIDKMLFKIACIGIIIFMFFVRDRKDLGILDYFFPFIKYYKKKNQKIINIIISVFFLIASLGFYFKFINTMGMLHSIIFSLIAYLGMQWFIILLSNLLNIIQDYLVKEKASVLLTFFSPFALWAYSTNASKSMDNWDFFICFAISIINLVYITKNMCKVIYFSLLKDTTLKSKEETCIEPKHKENIVKKFKKILFGSRENKNLVKITKEQLNLYSDAIPILIVWFIILIENLSLLVFFFVHFSEGNAFYLISLSDNLTRSLYSFFDCIYFTIITFSTVGLGDIRPNDIYYDFCGIPQIITIVITLYGMFFNTIFVAIFISKLVAGKTQIIISKETTEIEKESKKEENINDNSKEVLL